MVLSGTALDIGDVSVNRTDKNPGPHGTYVLVGKFYLWAKGMWFFIICSYFMSLSHCVKPFTYPQTLQICLDIRMLFSCLEYCCNSDQILSSPWSLLWLPFKRQTFFLLTAPCTIFYYKSSTVICIIHAYTAMKDHII